MTNYERILTPTIEQVANSRTTQRSYAYSNTCRNDAGDFSSSKYKGETYNVAIKAEIEWLNTEVEE